MEEGSTAAAHHFPPTMWSKVLRTRDDATVKTALDQLCRAYWQPVVGYVRALGCSYDEAEDVAQDFFSLFLRREGFQKAEQARGTLRSYLKAAIRHHVSHWRRDHVTQKRGSGVAPLALDDLSHEPAETADAAERYDEEWALTLLQRALQELKESYARRGKEALFHHLKPCLMSTEDSAGTALATELGMTRGALAVEQHRARKKLADLLRQEVLQTVSNEAEVEEELLHLLKLLAHAEGGPS